MRAREAVKAVIGLAVYALRSSDRPRPSLRLPAALPADASVLIAYLQEKGNQYRLYVQLSEQKSGFYFVVSAGLLAYLLSRIEHIQQGGQPAALAFLAALLTLGFSCYASVALATEHAFLPRWVRGDGTGPLATKYEPVGHQRFRLGGVENDALNKELDVLTSDLSRKDERDLVRDLVAELCQLARLHEQRVRVLRICVRSGTAGFALMVLALFLGGKLGGQAANDRHADPSEHPQPTATAPV